MLAVVAVDVNGLGEFSGGFGESELEVGANTVITMGEVDIAETEFFGCGDVRLRSVDGNEGLNAEFGEGFESGFVFGSAAGVHVGPEEIKVVDPGRIGNGFGSGRGFFGFGAKAERRGDG